MLSLPARQTTITLPVDATPVYIALGIGVQVKYTILLRVVGLLAQPDRTTPATLQEPISASVTDLSDTASG